MALDFVGTRHSARSMALDAFARLTDVKPSARPCPRMSDTDRPGTDGMDDSQLRLTDNQRIAQRLREAAELLRAQGANPFRVAAYRKAADTVSACGQSLRVLL